MSASISTPPARATHNNQPSRTANTHSSLGPPAPKSASTQKPRSSARKASAQPNGTLRPAPPHQGHVSDSAAQQTPSKKSNSVEHSDYNGQSTNGTVRKKQGKRKPQAQQGRHVSESIPNIDGTLSPRPSHVQPIHATHSPSASTATPIETAYAGPTFHASPAASTLPKPKFFSKSVPSAAPTSGLQAKLDAEPDSEKDKTPSPESDASLPAPPQPQLGTPFAREESPLDFFFSAHRSERARQQSSDTPEPHARANHSTPSLHPPTPSSSKQTPSTMPRSARSRPSQTPSGKQAFLMELDGQAEDADAEQSGQGYDSSDWDDRQASSAAQQAKVPFSAKLRGFNNEYRPSSEGGIQQGNSPFPQRTPLERNIPSGDLQRQAQSQALKRMLMLQPSSESKPPSQQQFSQPQYDPRAPPQQRHGSAQIIDSPLSPFSRRDDSEHQHYGRQAPAPVELPASPATSRSSHAPPHQRLPSNGYGSSNYSSIYGSNSYASPPPRQAQMQMASGSFQRTQPNDLNGTANGHGQQHRSSHDLRSGSEPAGTGFKSMEDDLRRMLRMDANGK